MQIKFLKKESFGYKFLLKDTRCDIVNAIRRTILNHVPTLAVNKVFVYKNESVMPDEMLAHRIGLVPVYAQDFEENLEYELYLKKTGGIVYSGDIEKTGLLSVPLKNIPLVVLKDNKTLELELVVRAGTGSQHVKHSPAIVYYNNVPQIKQHGDISDVENLCPKHLFEKKANKVFLKDTYACDICRYCEDKIEGAIELEYKDDEFVFTVEPVGNLDLSKIFMTAAEYLSNNLEDFKDFVKTLESKKPEEPKLKTSKKSPKKES